MNLTLALAAFLLMVLLVQLLIFRRRYIHCPPGKLLVIYGRVADANANGTKIIKEGAVFVWPVIQEYEFLELSAFKNDLNSEFLSKDKKAFTVKCHFACEVSSDMRLAVNSSVRLLGKKRSEVESLAVDLVNNELNHFLAIRNAEEIINNIAPQLDALEMAINTTLNTVGIELTQVKIELEEPPRKGIIKE